MPKISFPAWANTSIKKMAWMHRAEEKLRILHNKMGDWKRDGISQATYDTLPARIKNRYPFTTGVKLSDAQWRGYISSWNFGHDSLMKMLSLKRMTVVPQIEQDNTIAVDLETEISE